LRAAPARVIARTSPIRSASFRNAIPFSPMKPDFLWFFVVLYLHHMNRGISFGHGKIFGKHILHDTVHDTAIE
jgi:hypothetical protein